jgi:hypothetical protein
MKGITGAACFLLLFVQRVVLGTHDVYIVTMEGEPVVSYRGGVEGFPATAMDLDDELDVTRYASLLLMLFNSSLNIGLVIVQSHFSRFVAFST